MPMQQMMRVPKHRPRARTIDMDETTSDQIRTAAKYLGVSGHRLIQDAIRDKVRSVYGQIALDDR